jgi:hypothetical protein
MTRELRRRAVREQPKLLTLECRVNSTREWLAEFIRVPVQAGGSV